MARPARFQAASLLRMPAPLWVAALVVPFFAATAFVCYWKGVSPAYLLEDATVVGRVAPYAGFLSNVGILFWWATAVVCLFGGALLTGGRDAAQRAFLLAAGALTAFLALDDLFLLHDAVLPKGLGIPEPGVFAGYGAVGVWFAARFGARAFCAEGRLLLFAVACLAGSVVFDLLHMNGALPFLLEDGLKFIGIVSWSVYFVRLAWLGLRQRRM